MDQKILPEVKVENLHDVVAIINHDRTEILAKLEEIKDLLMVLNERMHRNEL